ncbi:MAG: ABC transporter substrate-binding protein [Pseudomonadota bacterium]
MKHAHLLAAGIVTAITATSAMADYPVTIDSCGKELTFDAAPARAIVHDLNMTEMFFALGLQEHMVGVTGITGWYKTDDTFKTRLGDIPELAPKYPTLENLVAVTPDFFFAGWYYGMKPGGEVTPDTLAPFDVNTLILTESCVHLDKDMPAATMDLLFNDMLKLGQIFGKTAEAEALVGAWRADLAKIRDAVGDTAPTRVFLYDSGEDQPFTAGRFAIPTAMMAAAGGQNVLADWDTSWGRTSWEAVAAQNPEFLILLDYQNDAGYLKLLDFLKAHPAMSQTDAVKNERFLPLRYAELTPGPANMEAIRKLAKAMHGVDF